MTIVHGVCRDDRRSSGVCTKTIVQGMYRDHHPSMSNKSTCSLPASPPLPLSSSFLPLRGWSSGANCQLPIPPILATGRTFLTQRFIIVILFISLRDRSKETLPQRIERVLHPKKNVFLPILYSSHPKQLLLQYRWKWVKMTTTTTTKTTVTMECPPNKNIVRSRLVPSSTA